MHSSPSSQAAASETTESASQAPVQSEGNKDTGLCQAEENKDTELSTERPLPVTEESEHSSKRPVVPSKSGSSGSPRQESLLNGDGRDSMDSIGNTTPRCQQPLLGDGRGAASSIDSIGTSSQYPLLLDQEGKNTRSTTIAEESENTGQCQWQVSGNCPLGQSLWDSLDCNSRRSKLLGLGAFVLIAGFALIMFCCMGAQSLPAIFMQFNIRVNGPSDWVPCEGKSWGKVFCPSQSVTSRSWSYAACVAVHNPSVFGTQEGLYAQMADTASILKGRHDLDYAYLGVGRAGTDFDSETSALFYKRSD